MVSTLDFESSDPSSNLGGTWWNACVIQIRVHFGAQSAALFQFYEDTLCSIECRTLTNPEPAILKLGSNKISNHITTQNHEIELIAWLLLTHKWKPTLSHVVLNGTKKSRNDINLFVSLIKKLANTKPPNISTFRLQSCSLNKTKECHCVGRESNPGQLLGRQLCSPLYHRRSDIGLQLKKMLIFSEITTWQMLAITWEMQLLSQLFLLIRLVALVSSVMNFLFSLPLLPFNPEWYDLSHKPDKIHATRKMKLKQA